MSREAYFQLFLSGVATLALCCAALLPGTWGHSVWLLFFLGQALTRKNIRRNGFSDWHMAVVI